MSRGGPFDIEHPILLDEDEPVAVTARRIKSRYNGIVCIVLGGLVDNRHRLTSFILIGKGQRCSLGKQSGKRMHRIKVIISDQLIFFVGLSNILDSELSGR